MNSGLNRLRDDMFAIYGDRRACERRAHHRLSGSQRTNMIGFHDRGLVRFGGPKPRVYNHPRRIAQQRDFFHSRRSSGRLLVSTREGPSRMHDGKFYNQALEDPMHRRLAFDFPWKIAPETVAGDAGRVERDLQWRCAERNSRWTIAERFNGGAVRNKRWQLVGRLLRARAVALEDGKPQRFTTADGLSNVQVRALSEDSEVRSGLAPSAAA